MRSVRAAEDSDRNIYSAGVASLPVWLQQWKPRLSSPLHCLRLLFADRPTVRSTSTTFCHMGHTADREANVSTPGEPPHTTSQQL